MSDLVLRREDFGLSDQAADVAAAFARLFDDRCSPEHVRSAPGGFDEALWTEATALDAAGIGVPHEVGGSGGGMAEVVAIAEEVGAAIAPIPLCESVTVSRCLARLAAENDVPELQSVLSGEAAGFAPSSAEPNRQLVAGGAVASFAVALRDDRLVLARDGSSGPLANLGDAPLSWWQRSDHDRALASGDLGLHHFELAVTDWYTSVASSLVGMGRRVLGLGVDYARDRHAFDRPIGTFQAVAHPLAQAHIELEGTRRLVRKAAWHIDEHQEAAARLAAMAFVQARRVAARITRLGIHVHGGVGLSNESDLGLYFRRARTWPAPAGPEEQILLRLADRLFGPAPT